MASATAALVGGSFAFVALAVASAIALYFAYRTKRLTKDEVQIGCTSNIVVWFCCWLLWICTWLHQWHPIIFPLDAANANKLASEGGH